MEVLKNIRHEVINFPRRLKYEMIKLVYYGNKVYCPCCEKKFKAFLPFGVKKRKGAKCPNCYSLERHRLLYIYLKEKTNLYKNKLKLLHIAPEKFFYTKFEGMQNIEYYPGDKFPKRFKFPIHKLDVTEIDFPDCIFDAVICSHVLEHVLNDKRAMSEIFRVLKPAGWAILQVPIDTKRSVTFEDANITDPDVRKSIFGKEDHVRWYGRDYKYRLKKAGFDVKIDMFVKKFSKEDIIKYGFSKNEAIYFCKRPKH